MLKMLARIKSNYAIHYKYTDSGMVYKGRAYFKTVEQAERFCTRLRLYHPDANIS